MRSVSARRGLTAAGVFFFALLALFAEHRALEQRKSFAAEEDVLYLPRPSALKALSLGHTELTADLVFIRALIYFGGQFHQKGAFQWLENYLETIVALDRQWQTPYRWAGVATMYNGRDITNESVLRSNHFLELGIQQFPRDWELPFMLGCNFLFELKPLDAETKESWTRQGAEWIRHAALVGGGPPWLPLLAATILRQEGQDEAAVKHLEEVYLTTQDERTRTEVRNRLLSLHAKIDFDRTERARKELERTWNATLPYVPVDFFVAIGPRPSPRLDVAALAQDPVLDPPTQ